MKTLLSVFNACLINKTTHRYFLLLSLLLIVSTSVSAVSNVVVTPADLSQGATTSYSVSFLNDNQLSQGGFIGLSNDNTGPVFSGTPLGPITLNTTTGTINGSLDVANQNNITINLGVGTSVPAGATISFTVTNVVNPGVSQGPDYTLLTFDFVSNIQVGTGPGNTYTASNTPVVSAPIADLLGSNAIALVDGPVEVVNDLDTVFTDGDGDTLTFTVDPGNDTNIATASINAADTLTVTPTGSGTTSITIRATSTDGTVTDTFDVKVIGELTNSSVTPQNLDSGATTTYDVSFNPASTIVSTNFIWVTAGAGGPDFTDATLAISGGSLSANIFNASTGGIIIQVLSGSASSADTVAITLGNVVNPGAAGQGPDYLLRLTDTGFNDIDRVTVPGSVYGAVGIPTVTTPITNQNLNEANGTTVIVADLNTVFTDGDGDTLTFSVEPGNDANIATASVNGNELSVTPTGPGITTITIKASDLPGGEGEVTDAFDVSVIGLMDNPSFVPQNFDTEAVTSYDFSFDPSSTLGADQFIIIANAAAGGPDFTSATLASISGGSLTANIDAQDDDSISIEITGGSATIGDTVSLVLNNVTNPTTGGTGPGYDLTLFRIFPLPTGVVEQNSLPGTTYNDSGLPVVTAPITDQVLNQVDGMVIISSDLNQVFTDGNGQDLSFSVLAGNDTNIATAQVNGDQLTVTPVGSGTTTITVEASDLADGGTGTVTDAFEVRVVGILTNASVSPMSLEVNDATVYDFTFTPASPIDSSHTIQILTGLNNNPDFSLATLENFSGGSLTAALTSQSPNSIAIEITGGTATTSDTISFGLNPVVNPSSDEVGADYSINVTAGFDLIDFVELPGNIYVDTDTIFINDFEPIVLDPDVIAKSNVALIPHRMPFDFDHPFYDQESQHYLFLGAILSRDTDQGQPRETLEVLKWLKNILIEQQPRGDWDQDGLVNRFDYNPFGIK